MILIQMPKQMWSQLYIIFSFDIILLSIRRQKHIFVSLTEKLSVLDLSFECSVVYI